MHPLSVHNGPTLVTLLRRAHTGEAEALRAVAEHFWPSMRQWAWWELGDQQLAEEAVQESLLRLMRFMDRWDPEQPFEPWLRALVRNAARDLVARRQRLACREVPAAQTPSVVAPSLERRLDLDRAAKRALTAIAALPSRQRELLMRVDHDGERAADVARDLGLSPGGVRNQLHTARRTLRARLLAHGQEVVLLLRGSHDL